MSRLTITYLTYTVMTSSFMLLTPDGRCAGQLMLILSTLQTSYCAYEAETEEIFIVHDASCTCVALLELLGRTASRLDVDLQPDRRYQHFQVFPTQMLFEFLVYPIFGSCCLISVHILRLGLRHDGMENISSAGRNSCPTVFISERIVVIALFQPIRKS